MQYFTRLGQCLLLGIGFACAFPALAAGTDAGTSVANSVTLDYSVNGGAQPQLTDSVTFVVDRKLDVLVTTADADWVTVTIGQEYAGLTGVPAANYTVTNNSNADSEVVVGVIAQGAVQVTTFTGIGGASAFTTDGIALAIDENANGTYDAGTDTLITPTNGVYDITAVLPGGVLAEDASVSLLVVLDVAATAADGEYGTYTLVAAAASTGAAVAQDASGHIAPGSGATPVDDPNVLGSEETVFGDIASGNAEDEGFDFFAAVGVSTGAADVDYDGQSSDSSGFLVAGVNLLVGKFAEVIYDPVSGNRYDAAGDPTGAEPKAIPGAVIMYVIGIANADATFTTDNINIVDNVDVGPVLEGNQTGDTVYNPNSVDVVLNPGAVTQTYALPAGLNIDQVRTEDCLDVGSAAAFGADPAEVSAGPLSCGPGTDAYVVYFVTVDTAI